MKKCRKSNFELLRIISILLIIGYHFCSETDADIFKNGFCFNQLYAFIIGSWGVAGVHCFFLISSYFLIKKNFIHSEKIFRIIFQTLFYSVIAVLICIRWNICPMDKSEALYNCISPLMAKYWFILAYCMMYITAPFLNIFLNNVTTSQLKKCVIVFTLIVPVILTIWGNSPCGTLGLAIYDYLLAALVEKKAVNISKKAAIIGFTASAAFIIATEVAGSIIFGKPIAIVRLTGRCSGFQILIAFFLFLIFENLEIRRASTIVNMLSQNTLGVYLIHESPLLGSYIRDNLLKINILYLSKMFPVYLLTVIVLTFVVSTAIDWIRAVTIEKAVFTLLKKKDIFQKTDIWINENN